MKKIFKIISLVMMMVMCFSVTAFAAETDETSNLKVSCTECVTQENENINPYMAEADFDEKAFGMILLRMKE